MTRWPATLSLLLLVAPGPCSWAEELTQQPGGQWRASKMAGVPIYGPDKIRIGRVSDVLLGPDGRAAWVIVGVGGVLGIGRKNVALPFKQVSFTNDPAPAQPQGGAADPSDNLASPAVDPSVGPAGTATTPGLGLGTAADTLGNPTGTGEALPRSQAYPDHGTTTMTAEQLKAAPPFSFAK